MLNPMGMHPQQRPSTSTRATPEGKGLAARVEAAMAHRAPPPKGRNAVIVLLAIAVMAAIAFDIIRASGGKTDQGEVPVASDNPDARTPPSSPHALAGPGDGTSPASTPSGAQNANDKPAQSGGNFVADRATLEALQQMPSALADNNEFAHGITSAILSKPEGRRDMLQRIPSLIATKVSAAQQPAARGFALRMIDTLLDTQPTHDVGALYAATTAIMESGDIARDGASQDALESIMLRARKALAQRGRSVSRGDTHGHEDAIALLSSQPMDARTRDRLVALVLDSDLSLATRALAAVALRDPAPQDAADAMPASLRDAIDRDALPALIVRALGQRIKR